MSKIPRICKYTANSPMLLKGGNCQDGSIDVSNDNEKCETTHYMKTLTNGKSINNAESYKKKEKTKMCLKTELEGNEGMRLTRSRSCHHSQTPEKSETDFPNTDVDDQTSTSSSPEQTACHSRINTAFGKPKRKSSKRRCKNRYFSMKEIAAKYFQTASVSHENEEQLSSDDSLKISLPASKKMISEDTSNVQSSKEKIPECLDTTMNNFTELDKVKIFDTDSASDDDKPPYFQQINNTTPKKTENKDFVQEVYKLNPLFERRDDSLRRNPTKRQLFQISHSDMKKCKGKSDGKVEKSKNVENKKTDTIKPTNIEGTKQKKQRIEVLEDDDNIIDVEEQLGRLVFANLAGVQWWPGIVIKGSMCNLYSEDVGCSWIYWFGDHKVSLVPHARIIPFLPNYSDKSQGKGKLFGKALVEVVTLFAGRCKVDKKSFTDDELLLWAKSGFRLRSKVDREEAELVNEIPDTVMAELKRIGDEILNKVASKSAPKSKHSRQKPDNRENAIEALKEGKCELKDICIGCSEVGVELVDEHPLFVGGVCSNCKSDILETMYAVDDDEKNAFCSICGCGGTLFLCDNLTCNRVYCVDCVDELAGTEILENIEKTAKWECFLCTKFNPMSHGLIKPKLDWKQRIVSFFETEMSDKVPSFEDFECKRPLRVLSLFDGIGTGILVLKELGLEIEEYYASEIDQDAIMVTSVHHGNQVKQIGDVTAITEQMISKYLPIDLLIGGSPCNDLSIANPDKKGFEFGGTGILFFEFVRVLDMIRKLQSKERHVFWLYENVASMKLEYKKVISRFLKCPAARWDGQYFSAQNRARYFWGNIPGLYSTPAISTHAHQRVTLNSLLTKNCKREATVDRLRTVTTRTNSLRLGKDDKGFPVKMDGLETGIWIPELERVFGFPSHYTDVGNLPPTRRQKLLGKAWSVSVVKNILMPLRQYYACSTQDE